MMLIVYIACGEVFDNKIDARDAESNAFNAWVDETDFAKKILGANAKDVHGNTISVLRNYYKCYVHPEPSIDKIRVVASEVSKDCTVNIGWGS